MLERRRINSTPRKSGKPTGDGGGGGGWCGRMWELIRRLGLGFEVLIATERSSPNDFGLMTERR